jgi:hypothetical protein
VLDASLCKRPYNQLTEHEVLNRRKEGSSRRDEELNGIKARRATSSLSDHMFLNSISAQ